MVEKKSKDNTGQCFFVDLSSQRLYFDNVVQRMKEMASQRQHLSNSRIVSRAYHCSQSLYEAVFVMCFRRCRSVNHRKQLGW